MLTAIVLAVTVPTVAGVSYLVLRTRLPGLAADVRGIALQTVIIMVVLLAIAGAIAGVLLARGGEAVSDVERQQISRPAADYSTEELCGAAGHSWSTTTCLSRP